jgi:PAS domain S-box-containing protein
VLAAVVDVTTRRRFERRLEAAVESAPLAIVMIESNGRIVLVNQEAERLFGYDRSELIGRAIEVLVPERYCVAHPANRAAFFAAPETRRMGAGRDLFACRKDGGEFPVEIGLNPIQMDGELYVLSVIADITERVESKKKIDRFMAELVRSNQELEQFAYIASHDLQEPLRKVASCCQVLADDYGPQLDDQAREWIGFAVDGATRMRQLVSDLLTYSRVGTQGKALVPTDAQAVCQAAIENLAAVVEETNADIRCAGLPRVMADEGQLIQLFQNLIGNALKYRAEQTPIVEIDSHTRGNVVRFSVRDNGIGIDPNFHKKIFEIFQRLHTKDQYSGTGIGLAICKKIALRMGGDIWVESQAGGGSTFLFTLALAPPRGDTQRTDTQRTDAQRTDAQRTDNQQVAIADATATWPTGNHEHAADRDPAG